MSTSTLERSAVESLEARRGAIDAFVDGRVLIRFTEYAARFRDIQPATALKHVQRARKHGERLVLGVPVIQHKRNGVLMVAAADIYAAYGLEPTPIHLEAGRPVIEIYADGSVRLTA